MAKHEQDEGQPGACSLPSEDWVDRNEVHETMCVRVRNFNRELSVLLLEPS